MCGILAFQIITLPVEINASKRGLAILQSQYLNENEYAGAWQMLYLLCIDLCCWSMCNSCKYVKNSLYDIKQF